MNLKPFSRSNPCPICDGHADCRYDTDENLILCHGHIDFDPDHPDWHFVKPSDTGVWGIFVPRKDEPFDRSQWLEKKAERELKQQREKEARALASLPIEERDRAIRSISEYIGLSRHHRQALLDRGLTDEQIRAGLFFSINPGDRVPAGTPANLPGIIDGKIASKVSGYACVTFDRDGRATGWQVRLDNATDDGKYRWAKGTHQSHLPNGELPIAVANPTGDKSRLWMQEGTLKPFVSAHRHSIACLGVSGGWFTSAREQTAEAVGEYGELVIVPDAGDMVNPQVMKRWERAIAFLESLGKPVSVAWWGQRSKDDDDIDEIESLDRVEFITPAEFFALAPEREPLPFWERLKRIAASARKKKRKPPTPKPLPTPDKRLYNRADRLNVWINGERNILDLSATGNGKSYDAGTFTPEMLGVRQLIYITNDPRNVTTPTLKGWTVLEGRHDGLIENELGELRRRKKGDNRSRLDRFREKKLRANCYRPYTHAALASKNIPRGGQAASTCNGCPWRESCSSDNGDFDYLNERRKALAGSRLIAHPSTLPPSIEVDPENGVDYSQIGLIWEESELSFNPRKMITVTRDDMTATITALALASVDNPAVMAIIPALKSLLALIDIEKMPRYGFTGQEIKDRISPLIPIDLDLQAVRSATYPYIDELLNPTAEHGKDIGDLPARYRGRFSEGDETLSDRIEREVLKQWIPELIGALDGKGYLSLDRKGLILSMPDENLRAIARTSAKNIFLSATENPEYLKQRLGIDRLDTVTTGEGLPDNIDFFQVTDLGRMGKSRGNRQKQLTKAIIDHYRTTDPENTAFIRFQGHAKEDGDRESLHHFVHSQGTNAIAGKTRLIIDGLPCPNIESLKHDFACFTGIFPDDENDDFKSYTRHRILSLLKQEIGRLRANLFPDRRFEIIFLTEYDLFDLIPSERIRSIKAHEITPDAETPNERNKRLITEAVDRLRREGKKISEWTIARVSGLARTTIHRLREFLDQLLATIAIDTPYSVCGQPSDHPEPTPDAVFVASGYLPHATDEDLLEEFGAALDAFPRRYWLGIWEAIPADTQERLLDRLISIDPGGGREAIA